MFSNATIPGRGMRVVNGWGATSAAALLSAARWRVFPTLAATTKTTCPAPSRGTCCQVDPRPPAGLRAASVRSLAIRRRMSARMCSVPLCLGIVAIISFSATSWSSGVVAWRKRRSASRYCGVRLAGTADPGLLDAGHPELQRAGRGDHAHRFAYGAAEQGSTDRGQMADPALRQIDLHRSDDGVGHVLSRSRVGDVNGAAHRHYVRLPLPRFVDHLDVTEEQVEFLDAAFDEGLFVLRVFIFGVLGAIAELGRALDPQGHLAPPFAAKMLELPFQLISAFPGEERGLMRLSVSCCVGHVVSVGLPHGPYGPGRIAAAWAAWVHRASPRVFYQSRRGWGSARP